MQVLYNPQKEQWPLILQRPYVDNSSVLQAAEQISAAVKAGGDAALISFAKKYDGVQLEGLQVSEEEIEAAASQLSGSLKTAIMVAQKNIETFHAAQLSTRAVVQTEA